MAVILNFNFLIVSLILWPVFYADACPPRCVTNGGACTFTNAQRCCSPICLEQYGICGKLCLPADSSCNIENNCCVPLACNTNTKLCKQCLTLNTPCKLDSDCCAPNACNLKTKIFFVEGCPPRCVKNGGSCKFSEPTKCCTPICLAQYGVCGKTCASVDSTCAVSNDCCTPLACEKNLCCTPSAIAPIDDNCCSNFYRPDLNLCCSDFGATCSSKPECCSRVCDTTTKTCVCNPSGNPLENPYTLCCGGFYRIIDNICCSVSGTSCVSNNECCNLLCISGKCL